MDILRSLTAAEPMFHKPTSSIARISLSGPQERQALARISFALGHVLRLYRFAAVSCGHPVTELNALEDALGRAQLPEEYIDIARTIATLQGPPAGRTPQGLTHSLHARFGNVLCELARALSLPKLEDEIRVVVSGAGTEQIDPEPLLAVARRLVQSLLVQRSTTEILEDCLQSVDGGIQRMAEGESDLGVRLGTMRERLMVRTEGRELETLRRSLIEETVALERLVAARRDALSELQRQSRIAQRRAERLLEALADATTAASTDPLTGLGNRRALADVVARLAASPTQIGVLAFDVDHFKKVNDRYGHAGGDRVLVQLGETLRAELRGDDHAFRVGGEEFVVLLARCDAVGALATAERIRQRVQITPTMVGLAPVPTTVSVGVALWSAGKSFEMAHDTADECLYAAKNTGRNKCVAG